MAAMSLVSCDNIAPEDRYIDVERNHSEKVVLLEEFTGQRCVNCPDAAEIVEQLHHAHPDNFIAVGMHPSASGFTQPLGPVNLRCEAADVYFDKNPEEMDEYESTLLAGIPNAPSVYAPTRNPDLAKQRQRQVLDKMVEHGKISTENANEILKKDYVNLFTENLF